MNDKKALHLSVNVLSPKALIGDMISTIFTSPTGDRTVILPGHLSHMKDQYPLTSQREYLHNNNNTLYLKRVTQKLVNLWSSQLFQNPEYWSGPGNQTCDLPLCSQVLSRLSETCCG